MAWLNLINSVKKLATTRAADGTPLPVETQNPTTYVQAPRPATGVSSEPAPNPTTYVRDGVVAPAQPQPQHTDVLTPAPFGAKTMNTQTGEGYLDGIRASEPVKPADVSVATPNPFGAKTMNTVTGEAFVDGKKVEPPAPPSVPTAADNLYEGTLKQIADGVNSNKPLPGTAAAIAQSREAMAQYAKSAEARAGMLAARTGATGQGTSNALGQQTRQDVLQKLAGSELDNVQAVSTEKQALVDKALRAGEFSQTQAENKRQFDTSTKNQVDQFGKTLAQRQAESALQGTQFDKNLEQRKAETDLQNSQFTANLDQRKAEFEKTFGSNEAATYRNQLERMAVDNPVLATKLTNYLLEGKTGSVGAFTPEELEKIKTFAAEKKGQQDKLDAVYAKVLESMPGQIDASIKAGETATKKAEETAVKEDLVKKMNSLQPGTFLDEKDFKTLEASGDVPRFSLNNLPTGEAATAVAGKVISLDGAQYRYVKSDNVTTSWQSRGILPDERKHTSYSEVVDAAGNTKYVYNGAIHDAPPKKDTSPY